MSFKKRREQEVRESFRVIARWEAEEHRKVGEFHRIFSLVMGKCLSNSVEWELYFRPSPDSIYEKMDSFASAHPWVRAKRITSTRLFYKDGEQWCEISYRTYSKRFLGYASEDKHSWSEPVSLFARSDREVAKLARMESLRFKKMLAEQEISDKMDKHKKLLEVMRQCESKLEENRDDIESLRVSMSKLSQQIAEKKDLSSPRGERNIVDWTMPTNL